jgi:non-ribosomal peptide synthetase component F
MSMLVGEVDAAVRHIAETMRLVTNDPVAHVRAMHAAPPPVLHRLIERHAALNGDEVAIQEGDRALTWRELNGRANAVARHLMAGGLRRGDLARIEMPMSGDLVIVLLAVLKAGGRYAWAPTPLAAASASVLIDGSTAEQTAVIHLDHLLAGPYRPSPNLPVMVRGTDAACVLHEGTDAVLVPHASITALRDTLAAGAGADCLGEPGALDVWMLLTSGHPVTIAPAGARAAA